jgi:hypothetical protein
METNSGHSHDSQRPVGRESRALRAAFTPLDAKPRPSEPAAHRYRRLVTELKAKYKISIRKWRPHMHGRAWELTYRDGTIRRIIEAPRPRGPVSAAIFLHEVGHHAVGFRRYHSRCLEEYYVWQWAFREMQSRAIPITPRVLRHFRKSMYHYVNRARQHHEHVPAELAHFGHGPV